MKRNLKPMVELKKVTEPELTPEQELEALENDQRLLKLVERHERGELLTGKDAKYFNSRIARHQALCELLGIEDEDEYEDDFEDDSYDEGESDFDNTYLMIQPTNGLMTKMRMSDEHNLDYCHCNWCGNYRRACVYAGQLLYKLKEQNKLIAKQAEQEQKLAASKAKRNAKLADSIHLIARAMNETM